jgi:hypothetical protein
MSNLNIKTQINALKIGFKAIKWGSFWKSEKTAYAVEKLEELDYKSIVGNIGALPVEERKTHLLELTNIMIEMINEADCYAGKLVNGSLGEWCPNAAKDIYKMWGSLLNDEPEVFDYINESLGDYGMN